MVLAPPTTSPTTPTAIFTLAGDTTLAGLETFSNDGTIELETFTLTGPAIAFDNAGTITTSGDASIAGFTDFSNSGTLDLAAGTFTVLAGIPFVNTGTVIAVGGATTITGQSLFDNQGTIDLVDGATDDVLTIDSDFVGSGASTLAVDFTGSDADLLVINGDASGTTAVDGNFLGGGFNLGGVLVVDAVTADTDAFVLGTISGDTPLVDFSLVQEGADFFLVSAPTAAAFEPLRVSVLATTLWYQSADEVFANTRLPAVTTGFSFWGQIYRSKDEYGGDDDLVVDGVAFDADNELETTRYGGQVGADYGFGAGRIGLTGGYAWAKAESQRPDGPRCRRMEHRHLWRFRRRARLPRRIPGQARPLWRSSSSRARSSATDPDARSTGIDGSVGYGFGIGGDAVLDAMVGVSRVSTKIDDIEDVFGFDYDIEKLTSTRGRAGLRATFGEGIAPYVDATVYREFDGDGDVVLFDGANNFDLDTDGKATWFRLEAGLTGNGGPGPMLAAWADLGDKQGLRAPRRLPLRRRGRGGSSAASAAAAAAAAASGDPDLPGRLGDPGDGNLPAAAASAAAPAAAAGAGTRLSEGLSLNEKVRPRSNPGPDFLWASNCRDCPSRGSRSPTGKYRRTTFEPCGRRGARIAQPRCRQSAVCDRRLARGRPP